MATTTEVGGDYEVLEIFSSRCQKIRNLRLGGFSLEEEQYVIAANDVFVRLKQLDLIDCSNVKVFIENTPIPNLKTFRYDR
jgi:hypothetical protein